MKDPADIPVTRRGLLALAAASLAIGPRRANAGRGRVVVVGAGLAGLSAARSLLAGGFDVIVLEGRDRIGGRIHTSRLWPDMPMDLGASWIHGTKGNPLTALAGEAGARLVETSYDAAIEIGPDGGAADTDDAAAARILRRALKAAENREADISVLEALEASSDWRKASPAERTKVRHIVNATLEQEYGGPARLLSAWYGDDGVVFEGGDALLPGGFDQITTLLAEGLDIRLGQEVSEIAPGHIRLAEGVQIPADLVICTVPLGVLKQGRIDFAENLAPARRAAIGALEMGLLNKCLLRFDRISWPEDVDWIQWMAPVPGQWAEWVSLARSLGAPVLLGFHAGDDARRLETLDDRATAAAAHDALRAMFGNAFPAPRAVQVTRWSQDPFCHGSYSYNAVGSGPASRKALFGSEWDGRLWFAGEAAAPDSYGTAHGAVMSGRRVAKAILSR
ncbi:amine oxidase [Zhengella mangrovi]|uniref:Tryptophan 2-monooxygenase n=1 Tax=Zhengella mangrovi TaxID=1982044 RepID=A0A2G1QNJ7_9HYPH|nr:FAD-dependent oxidoreductase [Zhengella mangrovi]PHP67055.1 amine oxidase [Zhengella mangrovi]